MREDLIKVGEISRAARVLTSSGLAPASEDTISKLAAKHPRRTSDFDDAVANTTYTSLIK